MGLDTRTGSPTEKLCSGKELRFGPKLNLKDRRQVKVAKLRSSGEANGASDSGRRVLLSLTVGIWREVQRSY